MHRVGQLVIMSLNRVCNNLNYIVYTHRALGIHYTVKVNTNPIKAHNNQLTVPVHTCTCNMYLEWTGRAPHNTVKNTAQSSYTVTVSYCLAHDRFFTALFS